MPIDHRPSIWHAPVFDQIQRSLSAHGLSIQTVTTDRDQENLASIDADALVLLNPGLRRPLVERHGKLICAVSTSSSLSLLVEDGADVVCADDAHGAAMAGHHLRQCGCERACFLGRHHRALPTPYDRISQLRLDHFELGWGEVIPPEHRLVADYYHVAAAAGVVPQYLALDPRPEAVFAAADELAVGFVCGAMAAGLVAGRDYHLVGFDGLALGQELKPGPLTTLHVPIDDMARAAAMLLTDRIHDPDRPIQRHLLGTRLVQGATTRPA